MKRQLYYPRTTGEQILWLKNFRVALPKHAAALKLTPATLESALADLAWLIYFKTEVIGPVRRFSLACSQMERDLMSGTGQTVVTVPPLLIPPPPADVPAVKPGALNRLFKLVATIKHSPGYHEEIGAELGITGNHHRTAESAVPVFRLSLIRGSAGEGVRGKFSRSGHDGVYVETRRGGGDWERLGMAGFFTGSTFQDLRPLLDPAQPEVREYRLRFWDDGQPTGEWSAVVRITVSP